MANFGQAVVGIIVLLIVVGGLLYIFYSRSNAVEKTGYGSLIMLALVSLLIPVFWIVEGNSQASAQIDQHTLSVTRGMQLYAQNCILQCYGIKNGKIVNPTYNGYAVDDLNQMSDDDLHRIISAGIFNPSAKQPTNKNAIPRSDQFGGTLQSSYVEYIFQLIRSADPAYLKQNGFPNHNGFDDLPDYLQNNNPTAYQNAVALGNPVDFGKPVDMTNQKAITIKIEKPSSSVPLCKSQMACYSITNVQVKVGTVITWVNTDTVAHTATAIVGQNTGSPQPATQIFDSGQAGIQSGQKFTYTVTADAYKFNPDHTVIYFCRFHPDMLAELTIVQ